MAEESQMIPAGMDNFVVGLIGMGDMGRLYAEKLSEAGWRILACDREDRYDSLKETYSANKNIEICRNGHLVSRASDYIIYSVEAAIVDTVIASYGPSTKLGAIVGGQTSCKLPEIAAFEKHLPADVDIISCHSLHGPSVDPTNQPLVLVPHRILSIAGATDEAADGDGDDDDSKDDKDRDKIPAAALSSPSLRRVEAVLRCLDSTFVYLSARAHDRITADTQAVTHAAFLSMGKAWHANRQFPWTLSRYVGGIENVKVNLMLRVYSQKWHVYAGLALLNPEARAQVAQYARSVTDLYKLMLVGDLAGLRTRLFAARDKVFGSTAWGGGGGTTVATRGDDDDDDDNAPRSVPASPLHPSPLPLIDPAVLNSFALGAPDDDDASSRRANNHLSLLAMVDCWAELGIVPYDHMLCATPLFRLRLGVTEHLFRDAALLDRALVTAVEDRTFRSDDLEFTFAARGWADCLALGRFDAWQRRFTATQEFFRPRFAEAKVVGDLMMKKVFEASSKP